MRVPAPLRRLLTEPLLRRRAIIVALTAALSPLPLLGTLGYESSLVLMAPLSLLGIGAGVDVVRSRRARPADDDESPASFIGAVGPAMLRETLGLAGLALGVLLGVQLWNPSCDPLEGIAFFGLGPALSAVLGGVCGLWGAVVVRNDARWRQLAMGLVPMLACLFVSARRLYSDPVVFVHDPFWAYFAGPLYDEAVAITPRYLWFRAYNVVAALAAVLALDIWALDRGVLGAPGRIRARPWSGVALAVLLAISGYFGLGAERHHFHATVDSLSHELGATLRTEHFVIHYDPSSAAARELELVAAEHEFAWHRLALRVGRAPEVPVHSFVFPDPEAKRELIGAGHTEVAPPWRGHLYLNDQPFPHRVLHHELAHAFSAPLGDPLFGIAGRVGRGGVQVNLALVEGFAEALAPRPRQGLDLHDQAAVLDRLELRPELESLMGLSFWTKSSRHAYAAAGSFCLWLVETRGVEPLVALYGSGGDFPGAYGETLGELESQWVGFLRDRPIRPRDIEAQRERYQRRAIFERPCAHRSANLRQRAQQARSRGDHQTSVALLETVCALEPEQTRHLIELGQAQAHAARYEAAVATLELAAADPEITHTLASAADEWLGDLAMLRDDLVGAADHYGAALGRSVSESVARRLQIKALGAHDPRLAPLVMDYFAPFEPEPPSPRAAALRIYVAGQIRALDGPHASLGAYLVGLQLLAAQDGARAAEAFEQALAPGPSGSGLPTPALLRGAREGLLDASVRRRDYRRAREVLHALMADPEIGNGDRYTYQLWSERIEFFRDHRPPSPSSPAEP